MLQNLNSRRGGFTLVEIMIVVAIIALLATFAVPSFMRARMRTQATACKEDLRQVDAAIDQWALEKNKGTGKPITVTELATYIKPGTALYTALAAGAAKDTLGGAITIANVGDALAVPTDTKTATDTATGADTASRAAFWSPFTY